MAYSCTTFGCHSGFTAGVDTYSTLELCQADCVAWGCPDSISINADLYFVYDDSNSFNDTQRELARTQVGLYLDALVASGWTGSYHHIYSDERWLDMNRRVYGQNTNITPNPGPVGGTSFLGYDDGFTGVVGIPSATLLQKDIVIVIFSNEQTQFHPANVSLNGAGSSWWNNYNPSSWSNLNTDREEAINIWEMVTTPNANNNNQPGTLKSILVMVSSDDPTQLQSEINFAIHSIGMIDSGNQNYTWMGGTGALDGTWIGDDLSPRSGTTNLYSSGVLPALCEVGDTAVAPYNIWGPIWSNGDGLEYVNNLYAFYGQFGGQYGGAGGLDQYGWSYDPTFGSISSAGLEATLTSAIGTVSGTATVCLSGAVDWNTSTDFPSSAQTECNVGCFGGGCKNPTGSGGNAMQNYDAAAGADCAGNTVGSAAYILAGTYGDESCCWDDPHYCTVDGCIPDNTLQPGQSPQFNSQEACETGCTSYTCTTSGCSLWNINGVDAGSGHLGTGGTYSTSAACSGTCVSWNCGLSTLDGGSTLTGCEEQAGTGGTYTVYTDCTTWSMYNFNHNACHSWDCAGTSGVPCLSRYGSGGTFYDPLGPAWAYTACTASCHTFECTDYGCVFENGTEGTYSSLNSCTAACQSWECISGGCETWNNPTGTTAQSYINASGISNGNPPWDWGGNLAGLYGTGGTTTEALCTATCFTWECGPTGCVDSPGNLGPWDWDEETDCNQQCVSYNCLPDGCEYQLGTGGTYTGTNILTPIQECQNECGSYNCDPLPSQPTTANAWTADSCTYSAGTGGTFYNPISLAFSLDDCQTGCTSWSCQNPFVPAPGGCLELPNTGNTLSVASYDACTADTACKRYDCTDTGCVVGDEITGTYNSLISCTGSCTSYTCTTSGCSYYNETGSTGTWTGVGHLGTGGTYDNANCDWICESWNCEEDGCTQQDGTGGTYTLAVQGAYASDCKDVNGLAQCDSWTCTDIGCIQHNITPGTVGYVDGEGGSGGTYSSLALCQAEPCTSWECEDGPAQGCVEYPGTGGTYTTENSCTGTCVSWNCGDFGCDDQLGTGGTYTTEIICTGSCDSYNCSLTGCDFQLGTGGTYTQALYPSTYSNCDGVCTSYDCTPIGCVLVAGSGGLYPDLTTCELNTNCTSWNCLNIGCTQQDGTGGTYTIAADGITADDCLGICDSWTCEPDACTPYNITPGTNSYYDGNGGTGGTFTTSSCEAYAIATVTITDFTNLNNGDNVNLTATDGTPWDFTVGTQSSVNGTWEATTSNNATADNLMNVINTSSGPSGTRFSASVDLNVVTITQNTMGCGGNTTIYLTDSGPAGMTASWWQGASWFSFTGGCPCTSWNCEDGPVVGCASQLGTGGTYTTENSCTGTCVSYNCTDTGCPEQYGTGGTYSTVIECTGGTLANNYLDSCTSWNCGSSSCNLYNAPNYGTGGTYPTEIICTGFCESYNCTDTGCVVDQGTGGMFPDLVTCTASCESYTCHLNGCIPHPNYGSGGTYTQELFPSTYNLCANECNSWDCEDDGCFQYNFPGPGGTGGTYDNSNCDFVCISYECEPMGCEPYLTGIGTGGTYSTTTACGLDCKSWSCGPNNPTVSTTGCYAFNSGDGTGGTYTVQSNCTSACKSYDCLPAGCAQIIGNDGGFLNLPNCLSSPSCQSWDCASGVGTSTGCSQYNVLYSPTYTNGSGGTLGSYLTNALCDIECKSWDCTVDGCEQYNVTGSASDINNNQGTGGTYTVLGSPNASTCDNICESWDCIYVQLTPGVAWSNIDACTWYAGSGYQYDSLVNCHTGCTSWTCVGLQTLGCTEFPNTASTYTDMTACTASTVCAYYDCTIAGCVLQPGEYMGGIDSYLLEQDCLDNCVGWGCVADTLASGTSIYVYYDVSNLTWSNNTSGPFQGIGAIRIDIQNYITTNYPTHVGNIYHTIVSDGNWLDWSNSIYHNEFRVAPATGTTPYHPTNNYDERALNAIGWANALTYAPIMGDWYDQYSANTYTNITTSTGVISTITTHGIAPTAHTSGHTLVIAVLTEANGVTANTIYDVKGYHSGVIGGGGTTPYMTSQPTTAWTTDYTANTTNHNAVTAATGTLRGLLVPRKSDPFNWTAASTKMCMLQGLAAIRPGNNVPLDGMYQTGTAPVALAGPPGMDYSQIEVSNPYWPAGVATYGNLEAKGWGFWQEGGGGAGNMDEWIDDVLSNTTLDQHLQLTSPAVGTCISAETLYTINTTYPHELEATCTTTCEPQYYSCTTTGCSLSWAGTMSLAQCQSICTSVSCTTSSSVGCEVYNSPGSLSWQNGQYGTGGTFTGVNMMSDCQLECISYECDPVANYVLDAGCQSYIGTGQTYYETTPLLSYSACTGDCRSWHCDEPCDTALPPLYISTGVGCIEYLNTGATHLTLLACTGVCQENWYCTTASTIDSCDGLIHSTIISGDIDDHIDKIASTPGWTNILFQDFKFSYITIPTNALNTCYSSSTNSYLAKVTGITITLSSTIPASTIAYSWDDVTDFMDIHYPLTTISTISDIENIGGVTLTYHLELCSCVDIPCTIGCTGTTVPAWVDGPHDTYAIAETECCSATTWSCATNTIIDDCDGLTLIPGLFTDAEGCYEWLANQGVGTYALNVTTLKCEVMPSVPLAQCELGPNYGQLIRLTGITSDITAISSNNYTSLSLYVAALQGISVPNAVVGLPLDVLQDEVQLVYINSVVTYGWADCECDNPYSCGCVELFDGTGSFTSKTHCELSCCTATTWSCVSGTEYLPICGNKTHLGDTNDTTSLLEWYRTNSPTTLFGLNTWSITTSTPVAWAQVQANMLLAGPPYIWNDCYSYVGGLYYPTLYLYTISHPLINGGALYQTWDDFYTVVNAVVGITLSVSDTIADINTKINTHFGTTVFNVVFDIKSCCSDDDCYCYDTLDSSGSYANELLCDSSCCPSNTMSWSCIIDSTLSCGCTYGNYGPPINTSLPSIGPWATISECEMLSLGCCSTSWKCEGVSPNCECVEVLGHYTVTGHYPTEWLCDNNTNVNDCCGLPITYTCDTGIISSNMTGLDNGMSAITATTLGFPNLGYLTIDDVLTYLADPTASPTNQNTPVTEFSFCLEESSQTILNNLPEHCKCGDGCNGVLHFATGFTFSHFNLGSTDTANAFHILNYPYGYCTTWADFITQLNIVWGFPNILSVNLSQTYQQVVDEVNNGIGVSQFGVGTTSCVDSSTPCGCVGNTLGIGVSLADCSSSCCTETLTYTCTIQGCRSRCDGTGEYPTLQECELECWEWRCNQDIWGCTDPNALNYNPLATIDDGSCILPNDFWSCAVSEGCSGKTDTGAQTLSHVTGQISAIAANSQSPNNWHLEQFETFKYSLGGGNNQPHPSGGNDHLPCVPCEAPGNWGQPGPYYAYIKYVMYSGLGSAQYTTWKTFIDDINALGYSFQYGLLPGNLNDRWQELEAVLGSSQLNCVWDWCDCSDAKTCIPDNNGNYVSSAQCYSDVLNECTSWMCNSSYVESCSGATTYMGPYTNFGNAYDDYISTYPLIDLTAYTFSVATIPLANTAYWASVGIPPCTPPVGPLPVPLSMFPLLAWTGMTINPTSTLAGSMTQLSFISWLDLVNAINAAGTTIPTLNTSMSYTVLVQTITLAGYGNVTNGEDFIAFLWGYCMCGYIDCDCIEVPDGTGPYQSFACCEEDEDDDNCCYYNWDCPWIPK